MRVGPQQVRIFLDRDSEYREPPSPPDYCAVRVIEHSAKMNGAAAASNGFGEAYMLTRGSEESARLNTQHGVMKELLNGHLVDPLVPLSKLRAVADVGTGTGIWLKDAAKEIRNPMGDDISFVGFDISAAQFPSDPLPQSRFVVHDVVEPFPAEYHESFDLVHVRFLNFALKLSDLERAVTNVINIIRQSR